MKKIIFFASAVLFLTVFLTGCFEKAQNSLKALEKPKYMVVDIFTSSVSYMDIEPIGGWSDEYKTTKLVLRRIEPGTFIMGSPDSELGHDSDETQHEVTLTKPFYIGVFEITQKQYQLITGNNPSTMEFRGDTKPVDNVSYNEIRGMQKCAQWPANNEVDDYSFLGKLRARTKMNFDLPTEAQWEYACRAGTTTSLNNGTDLSGQVIDQNLNKLGRYSINSYYDDLKAKGHTFVGSYLPNSLGLYDMHGNVNEWCLDWYGEYPTEHSIDPIGPGTDDYRVFRGGGWIFDTNYIDAYFCRSASRRGARPNGSGCDTGFRVVLNQ
jgi:formylglycine-generating enzyme required for sulfatase activity